MTSKKAQPIVVVIGGVEHTQGIQFWFVATRLLFAIIPPHHSGADSATLHRTRIDLWSGERKKT
jgi:hypothetical protein